ncbi:MAG: GerMN domain-containing protein [Halanaerobiales bacterium]|nr:GerMN domain-containing protein [Halanaerobiales bacterium]
MSAKILSADQKRKLLLILRILVLTAAVLYLIFLGYNNYLLEKKVKVYFAADNASYLLPESRSLDPDIDRYLQIFEELKAGPESDDLTKTIPEGSRLIDYQLDGQLLTLNFNRALKDNHWGGSTGERLTVYSIVNSYTALSEVESVKILLEGKEVESLVGHLDLSRPLMYNQKLTEGN